MFSKDIFVNNKGKIKALFERNTFMEKDRNKDNEAEAVKLNLRAGKIFCFTIIGEIEGHISAPSNTKATKYEHIIPELVRIEEDKETDGVLFILNTIGGDVEAGLAIAELIASMKKPTASIVLGGGHSIGVPLAVSAKKSFIVPSATMTVHPIRTNNLTITAPQTFKQMMKVQDRLIDFVSKHSSIEKEKFEELMLAKDNIANDVGTVLYGEEAVDCGLIDMTGGISEALFAIGEMINNKNS